MSPDFAPIPIVYKDGINLNFKNEVDRMTEIKL